MTLLSVIPLIAQGSSKFFNVKNVVKHHKGLFDKTEFGFVDLHNSILARLFKAGDPAAIEDTNYFVNSKWIKESGLKLIFLSIGIPRFSMENEDTISIKKILLFLRSFKDYITSNHNEFVFVKTDSDAIAEIEKGNICFVYAIEGMNLIGDDLNWIDSLYKIGVRMMGIGHVFTDQVIKNSWDMNNQPSFTNDSSEISEQGLKVIDKLIEKGILIDLSHLGQKAFWEAIKIINRRQPIIVSHTAAKTVATNFRNLDDKQIKCIDLSNGLIGITFHSLYLSSQKKVNLDNYKMHFEYLKSISQNCSIFIGSDLEGNIKCFNDYNKVF